MYNGQNNDNIKTMKDIIYPYLPEGRVIFYVDQSNKFMTLAKEEARKSKEKNQPTGAVAVINGAIVGAACNKPPIENKNLAESHKKWCIRRLFGIKTGEKYWACPGCAAPKMHAETRVSIQVIKKNLKNFDLYLYGHWWCCKDCWDAMIKAGVKDVYLLEGSEIFFNRDQSNNILHTQFK